MPAFMSKTRGVVVRLNPASGQLGGPAPFSVRIENVNEIGNPNGTDSRVLITQVTMSEAGSFQLQHTFGKTIYAYIFGDRVGELKLAGMCFAAGCSDQPSGITTVYNTYDTHRVAVRTSPMIITFGGRFALIGLLTGMSMEMADPETQLMQWSYRFNTFRTVG